MAIFEGPPESVEAVDFTELRAAIEAAIADSRAKREAARTQFFSAPTNMGINDVLINNTEIPIHYGQHTS